MTKRGSVLWLCHSMSSRRISRRFICPRMTQKKGPIGTPILAMSQAQGSRCASTSSSLRHSSTVLSISLLYSTIYWMGMRLRIRSNISRSGPFWGEPHCSMRGTITSLLKSLRRSSKTKNWSRYFPITSKRQTWRKTIRISRQMRS